MRTVVIGKDGEVLSDATVPDGNEAHEPTAEEIGDGVAETLTDLADLVRKSSRVAGKVGRLAKMVGAVVGPLDRPLPERAGK